MTKPEIARPEDDKAGGDGNSSEESADLVSFSFLKLRRLKH